MMKNPRWLMLYSLPLFVIVMFCGLTAHMDGARLLGEVATTTWFLLDAIGTAFRAGLEHGRRSR